MSSDMDEQAEGRQVAPVLVAAESAGQARPRDRQVSGNHYLGAIQPYDYAMAQEFNYFQSHALVYLTRYQRKGTPIDDLRKLIHLAEMEIDRQLSGDQE